MDRPRGAFVDDVQPGSPAAAGGVENDDIVIEFNDHVIEASADLPFFVGQYRPDTTSDLLIFRNGELQTLQVTLGSSPTNEVSTPVAAVIEDRRNPLGFWVSELSDEAVQVSGLNGVRISELNAGPGQKAGLAAGDVIVSLNRQEISNADQFAAIASQLPESGFVPIRIVRGGQGTTLALELVR
jgi:serine protease Do